MRSTVLCPGPKRHVLVGSTLFAWSCLQTQEPELWPPSNIFATTTTLWMVGAKLTHVNARPDLPHPTLLCTMACTPACLIHMSEYTNGTCVVYPCKHPCFPPCCHVSTRNLSLVSTGDSDSLSNWYGKLARALALWRLHAAPSVIQDCQIWLVRFCLDNSLRDAAAYLFLPRKNSFSASEFPAQRAAYVPIFFSLCLDERCWLKMRKSKIVSARLEFFKSKLPFLHKLSVQQL